MANNTADALLLAINRIEVLEDLVIQQNMTSVGLDARITATGDVAWTLVCAAMVFFMQAGFALVESGCCRFHSTQSILMKNLMDSVCGTFAWTFIGSALAFGDSSSTYGLFGTTGFGDPTGNLDYNLFHFQWSFAACTATIVSGGVAERIPMEGYIIFSMWMTSLIYPVVVCWAWGGGWLAERGFADFAGSGVVHMTGGFSAIMGAKIIGPRDGRFGADRWKFNPHSVPNIVLGTLILWFGWYGFNPGSTAAMGTVDDATTASRAAVATTLGAGSGGMVVYGYTTYIRGQYDVPGICNGVLGGLVAITAGCANVHILSSMIVGGVGGFFSLVVPDLLESMLIDDPVGAFPVHGICGMWGVIATWLFDSTDSVALDTQIIGLLAIAAWSWTAAFIIFSILKWLGYGVCSTRDQRRGQDAKYKNDAYMSSSGVTRFKAFLSHHKMDRGSFSRLLQLELGAFVDSRARIFLDSDNLVNLDTLMQTVREKTDMLIVIESEIVWWRPWVIGEITQASMAQVPILFAVPRTDAEAAEMDNTVPPINFDAVNAELPDKYAEFQDDIEHLLQPYGIFYSDIEQAYQQLGTYGQIVMEWQNQAKYVEQLEELGYASELLHAQTGVSGVFAGIQVAVKTCTECVDAITKDTGAIGINHTCVILGDVLDIEAVSTMRIVSKALTDMGERALVSADTPTEEILDVLDQGASGVIILSENVTRNLYFTRMLIQIGQSTLRRIVVPMSCDKLAFEFPGDEAFERIILEVAESLQRDGGLGKYGVSQEHMKAQENPGTPMDLQKSDADQITVLIAFYTYIFRLIALPYSNHSSWRTIDQQVRSLFDRLHPLDKSDDSSLWQGPTAAITANAARKVQRAVTDPSIKRGNTSNSDVASPRSKGSTSPKPEPKQEPEEVKPAPAPEPQEEDQMKV